MKFKSHDEFFLTGVIKKEIAGYYDIREPGVFGFVVDDSYDPGSRLIIDPELVYSTYLGGNSDDYSYDIAVDGSGCAYVIGDVNGSGNYNGLDITYGVAYLKGDDPPLCDDCMAGPGWRYCSDVNGSCSYNGLDITYGVAYLKGGDASIPCPACPPAN